MQKIPTLFVRDARTFGVINQVKAECQWVIDGEGIATEKLDGTNVRVTIQGGKVTRYEKRRNPTKAEKAAGQIDGTYVQVEPCDPADQWIAAALEGTDVSGWPDGEHCCEAIGPKIQGNPLGTESHRLIPFDLVKPPCIDIPRDYESLQAALQTLDSSYAPGHVAEGIVFHHPDGRRAKIKRKDFRR